MADEAAAYNASLRGLLEDWRNADDRSAAPSITTALRRCVHAITIDAANHNATVDLRTLPVIASGPAFQAVERVQVDLHPSM